MINKKKKKIFLVILNYNGWQDTIDCVRSLDKLGPNEFEVVIVDNASTDNSYSILKKAINSSNVVIIRNKINLGYAGGNNMGITYALAQGADFICILNNDTLVEDDFISPCIQILEADATVAFVGPAIVNIHNDLIQSTGGDIFINRAIGTQKNNNKSLKDIPEMIECGYIGGACLLFRADMIDILGLIPESYFLFYEETEWCYQAKRKGYRNLCLGNVMIRHKGSVSIKKTTGLNEYLLNRNRIVFLRRNHPIKAFAFAIYIVLCVKAFLSIYKYGLSRLEYIRYYTDGWLKKVDCRRYPFIVVKE